MSVPPIKSLVPFLTVLFLTAFAAYLAAWKHAPYSTYDTASYLAVARDLQDGSLDALHDRTVGYPFLLLLTQSAERPSRSLFVIQLVLHFVAAAMLAIVLHQHGFARRSVLWFATACVSPPFLVYTAYALTESVLAFCIVLTFCGLRGWLLSHSGWGLAASTLGTVLCGLIRPSLFAVGIVCAAILVLWQKSVPAASLDKRRVRAAQWSLTLVPLAICVVMVGFNRQRFHYTGLTPMMWKYLSTKTVRLVERIPDSEPVKEYLVSVRDKALVKPRSYHNGQAYMHDLDKATLSALTGIEDEGELAQYLTRLQLRLIANSPLVYLLEVGEAMVIYCFPQRVAPNAHSPAAFWLWVIVDFGLIGLFFVVTALQLSSQFFLRHWRLSLDDSREGSAIVQEWLCFSLASAIIWYNTVSSSLFSVGETRYRYPVDMLILLSIVLSYQTLQKVKKQVVKLQSEFVST